MRILGKALKWIFWIALALPRLLGTPAAMRQVQESAPWWAEAWCWIVVHDLHFWVPMVLLALGFLAFDLRPLLPRFLERLWHNKDLYSKLMQEHDDMRPTRTKFWSGMQRIYDTATPQAPGHPYKKLDELISAAEALDPDIEGDAVSGWENSLSGASKELWEFVAWAYHAKGSHVELPDDPFEHQGAISNYWNKVGAAIYDEEEISERKVLDRHFPHQSRLLKIVLYVERMIELQLGSRKLRKPYAFKMYQRAKAAGETYDAE